MIIFTFRIRLINKYKCKDNFGFDLNKISPKN